MPPVRIAVVSPFIDKRHGTERRIAEWITRLQQEYEIHIYSQRVEDVDLTRMRWHRIPQIPGPHLLNFLWWLAANHLWRWCDANIRGLRPRSGLHSRNQLLGCGPDLHPHRVRRICSHVRAELRFRGSPLRFWPRLIHRWLYYRLIIFLESRMYTNPKTGLILIAKKTADDLKRHYGIQGPLPVVYIGMDHKIFNRELRLRNRPEVRKQLGIADDIFTLVMVGNDWKKKGLVATDRSAGATEGFAADSCCCGQGRFDPLPKQDSRTGTGRESKVLPVSRGRSMVLRCC